MTVGKTLNKRDPVGNALTPDSTRDETKDSFTGSC